MFPREHWLFSLEADVAVLLAGVDLGDGGFHGYAIAGLECVSIFIVGHFCFLSQASQGLRLVMTLKIT